MTIFHIPVDAFTNNTSENDSQGCEKLDLGQLDEKL